jgi:hypothetical protein
VDVYKVFEPKVSGFTGLWFAHVSLAWFWGSLGVESEAVEDIAAKNGMDRTRMRHDGSDMTTRPTPSSMMDQIATSVVAPIGDGKQH